MRRGPRPSSPCHSADIAALAPDLRMYHVMVRDPKGRALPSQITNYQHDHRGASYDDLVFAYDFAAGEKRALFTLEPTATATPPDTPCAYARIVPERFGDMAWENDRIAHRMYGFELNTPDGGRSRRAPARQRHRRLGQTRQLSDHRSLVRQGARPVPQGRGRRRPRSLQHRRLARRRRHGRLGRRQVLDLRQFRQRAGVVERPAARGVQPHIHAVGCGCRRQGAGDQAVHRRLRPQFRRGGEHLRFRVATRPWSASASPSIRRPTGFPEAVLTRDPDGRWMSYWEENKDGGLGSR